MTADPFDAGNDASGIVSRRRYSFSRMILLVQRGSDGEVCVLASSAGWARKMRER